MGQPFAFFFFFLFLITIPVKSRSRGTQTDTQRLTTHKDAEPRQQKAAKMNPDMQPMNQTFQALQVDTGVLAIPATGATEADGTVLLHDSNFTVPGPASSVRIHFDADQTQLPGTVGVDPSFIKCGWPDT